MSALPPVFRRGNRQLRVVGRSSLFPSGHPESVGHTVCRSQRIGKEPTAPSTASRHLSASACAPLASSAIARQCEAVLRTNIAAAGATNQITVGPGRTAVVVDRHPSVQGASDPGLRSMRRDDAQPPQGELHATESSCGKGDGFALPFTGHCFTRDGAGPGQAAEHRRHHGRRHRHVEHRRVPPRPDGRAHPEHRPTGQPGHDVHRLLRRGQLHGRARQLHHRRAAHPHRHDHGRPGRLADRYPGAGGDHRHRAQGHGLRHRPVRQRCANSTPSSTAPGAASSPPWWPPGAGRGTR